MVFRYCKRYDLQYRYFWTRLDLKIKSPASVSPGDFTSVPVTKFVTLEFDQELSCI